MACVVRGREGPDQWNLAPSKFLGMAVHGNTSIYSYMGHDIKRLGTFAKVHAGNITLTYSQFDLEYTYSHPHPFRGRPSRSQ
jgi:hypothetical protein